MEANYDRFLRQVGLYTNQLSEQDQMILRVTRIFGECELGMPKDFVSEVKRYIGYGTQRTSFKRRSQRRRTKATIGVSLLRSWLRICLRSFSILPCRKVVSIHTQSAPGLIKESPKACGSSYPRPPSNMASSWGRFMN